MTQQVKVLANKSDNRSLIPRTHVVEDKPIPTTFIIAMEMIVYLQNLHVDALVPLPQNMVEFETDGRSMGSCEFQSLNKGSDWLMARKAGQWEEEEVARERLQEERREPAMKRCRITRKKDRKTLATGFQYLYGVNSVLNRAPDALNEGSSRLTTAE
ncbi:hypothetical protein STEG23_037693, partial [Scotinomys teguina]